MFLALCMHIPILLSLAATTNALPLPTGLSLSGLDATSTSTSTSPNTSTPTADPAWAASPTQRGTYQLLLGCLTTLSLCAWTAYHPNVRASRGAARALGRRGAWMLAAVVAPEVVLYYAWEQRWMAALLRRKVGRLGGRAVRGFAVGGERARARAAAEVSVFCFFVGLRFGEGEIDLWVGDKEELDWGVRVLRLFGRGVECGGVEWSGKKGVDKSSMRGLGRREMRSV
ncbi:uncharacterized protein J3D65DRAFT_139927 [Phyllosticta citribraziliensis]|uniref:Uncharacterized protein n=1 Tax=Phyllosticta citribraziliensis TaxID=989973 RepID=A0ABR1LB42_9PEZI